MNSSVKIDKNFIARHRLRFALGANIVGTFFFVFSLLTFAKVWEETFIYYDIPVLLIYIGMPLFYVFICWSFGYIYDTQGFWKEETSHSNLQLNPEITIILSNLDVIKQNTLKIDKLQQSLDDIKDRVDKIEK